VDRTACVDVPALPLQLVLRRHPEWTVRAAAVVGQDRPQGLVLGINEAASRSGVRTGMRYGAALCLAPDLRADTVSEDEIAAGVAAIVERLLRFTPGVEPSPVEPGVFHLDASGLLRLHGSLEEWAAALRRDLVGEGFRSRIAVGFTRFGVYAAAKSTRGALVFETAADEARATRRVPLDRLGVDPPLLGTLGTLAKLGVRTVEDFLRLPEEAVLRRFGEEARRLRRFAAGGPGTPLARVVPAEPLVEHVAWEHPETDATRLVFLAKRLLDSLLATAVLRAEAVSEIRLRLVLDRNPPVDESLRPAAPTLDGAQLLDLVRLRLASLRLASGVTGLTMTASCAPATEEQLRLFVERPRRDPAAAERAFARLTAEFGEDAVVVARLADGHLPEAAFAWEPFARTVPARPRIVPDPPLVRRIFERPVPLPPRPRRGRDGRPVQGFTEDAVVRLSGPYVLAGGWWTGAEVRREIVFAETADGRVLWAFLDRPRRRWFLQGRVE
jgi:protein ImuB